MEMGKDVLVDKTIDMSESEDDIDMSESEDDIDMSESEDDIDMSESEDDIDMSESEDDGSNAPSGKSGNAEVKPTDRQWARARRAAQAKAQADMQKFKDEIIERQFGHLTNPYTGNRITTESEYNSYVEEYEAEQMAEMMSSAGLSEDVLNKIIASHPTIKRAEELISRIEEEESERALNGALEEIGKLNPDIKDFEDLMEMDNFDLFNSLVVEKGYDMVDAYRLASLDRVIESEKDSAAAAAASAIKRNSKASPGSLGGGNGRGSVSISSMSDDDFESLIQKVKDGETRGV